MFLSVNSHVLWTLTLENGLTACRNHYLYWPKHVEAIISLFYFSLLIGNGADDPNMHTCASHMEELTGKWYI